MPQHAWDDSPSYPVPVSDFDDQFNAMARPALLAAMGDTVTYRRFDGVSLTVPCLLGPVRSIIVDDSGISTNYSREAQFSTDDVPARRHGERVIVDPGTAGATEWVVDSPDLSADQGMVTVGLFRSSKNELTMPGLRR